jgi:hypothetical protein
MTTRVSITEEDGTHKAWAEEARKQTLETLPEFLRHLTEDYGHDYGTICHAMSAGALAAAWAVNASPQGGITGFQAGAVMWGFVAEWQSLKGKPLRLTDYSEMLFPQYGEKFKTISPDTWKYLQEKAAENLAGDVEYTSKTVISHWQSIVDGNIPFGLTVGG